MTDSHSVFFGVDFSGATQPSDALWITEAETDGETLTIKNSVPAWKRFDLSRSTRRTQIYDHLREFIAGNPNAVFGFDFPFSLPHRILSVDSWRQHIVTIPDRFDIESPDEFREECIVRATRATDSSGSHLRRETDYRYAAQCPYQRQIQNQTLFGQSEVLRPLVENDQATVLPMQEPNPDLPIIVEVYPRATLGVFRTYRTGYKNHPESQQRRECMLKDIERHGYELPGEILDQCIESDDALDSVICSIATHRAQGDNFRPLSEEPAIEGWIYA